MRVTAEERNRRRKAHLFISTEEGSSTHLLSGEKKKELATVRRPCAGEKVVSNHRKGEKKTSEFRRGAGKGDRALLQQKKEPHFEKKGRAEGSTTLAYGKKGEGTLPQPAGEKKVKRRPALPPAASRKKERLIIHEKKKKNIDTRE